MTAPKPPKGFDSWLDWCVQNAEYRDLWIERNCPMGGEQPHYMEEAAQAELAALRARVIAAEDRCDEHVAHVVEIGDVLDAEDGETALEAAKRVMRKLDAATNLIAHTAARVAELEREMEKEVELRMHSLRIGLEAARREAKKIADLEQQVAALADALEKCCDTISEWYVQDREGVETAAQARLLAYLNVPALSKARNLLANMKEQAALRAAGRKT